MSSKTYRFTVKNAQQQSGGGGSQGIGNLLRDFASSAGSQAQNMAGNMSGQIGEIWNNLSEQQQSAIIRGLVGAAAGGTALGASRRMSGNDGVLGQILLGLLLGGTAGAGSTMIGDIPGAPFDQEPGAGEKALNAAGFAARNSGTVAGPLLLQRFNKRLGRMPYTDKVMQAARRLRTDGEYRNVARAVREHTPSRNPGSVREFLRDRVQDSDTIARLNTSESPTVKWLSNKIRGAEGANHGKLRSLINKAIPRGTTRTNLVNTINKNPAMRGVRPTRFGSISRGLPGLAASAVGGNMISRYFYNRALNSES